jgi:hypothetical protein
LRSCRQKAKRVFSKNQNRQTYSCDIDTPFIELQTYSTTTTISIQPKNRKMAFEKRFVGITPRYEKSYRPTPKMFLEGQNRLGFPSHHQRTQAYYLISKRMKLLSEHADG